jgi:hypothetical protein
VWLWCKLTGGDEVATPSALPPLDPDEPTRLIHDITPELRGRLLLLGELLLSTPTSMRQTIPTRLARWVTIYAHTGHAYIEVAGDLLRYRGGAWQPAQPAADGSPVEHGRDRPGGVRRTAPAGAVFGPVRVRSGWQRPPLDGRAAAAARTELPGTWSSPVGSDHEQRCRAPRPRDRNRGKASAAVEPPVRGGADESERQQAAAWHRKGVRARTARRDAFMT